MKHVLNKVNDADGSRSVKYLASYIYGTTDDDLINTIIRSTFGVNIHEAANMLYYQDKFFNYQMPYLIKYLEDLKVGYSVLSYRYADTIMSKDIFSLDVVNKRDPNKLWTDNDLNYTGSRSRDILNPYNCFYRVNMQLSIDNNNENHTMFLLKAADAFNLGDNFREKIVDHLPINLEFNDMQCGFYEAVNTIIRLVHRYL